MRLSGRLFSSRSRSRMPLHSDSSARICCVLGTSMSPGVRGVSIASSVIAIGTLAGCGVAGDFSADAGGSESGTTSLPAVTGGCVAGVAGCVPCVAAAGTASVAGFAAAEFGTASSPPPAAPPASMPPLPPSCCSPGGCSCARGDPCGDSCAGSFSYSCSCGRRGLTPDRSRSLSCVPPDRRPHAASCSSGAAASISASTPAVRLAISHGARSAAVTRTSPEQRGQGHGRGVGARPRPRPQPTPTSTPSSLSALRPHSPHITHPQGSACAPSTGLLHSGQRSASASAAAKRRSADAATESSPVPSSRPRGLSSGSSPMEHAPPSPSESAIARNSPRGANVDAKRGTPKPPRLPAQRLTPPRSHTPLVGRLISQRGRAPHQWPWQHRA